jgi:hypothetical protein
MDSHLTRLSIILTIASVLISGVVSVATASWWLSALEHRVKTNEERRKESDDKLDKLLTKLEVFIKEEQDHNMRDETFRVRMDEKVGQLVDEFQMLHEEIGLHQPRQQQHRHRR